MIEKVGNTAKNPTQKGCHLRANSILRIEQFFRGEKHKYATCQNQERNGLFTLQSRTQEPSSRLIQSGLQEGQSISNIHRYGRLLTKQQRCSFESSPTYTVIYAKDTEPNTESHQELSTSICRSYRKGTKPTIKRIIGNLESSQSGALQSNAKTNEINLFEIVSFNSKQLLVIFCFMAFRICLNSALTTFDIMSISAVNKAQIKLNQKS
mgnify:CR=1 FL=1